MEKEIIGICGDGPLAEIELIGNDPNFVFVNDVSFPTVVLYNDQGSVINVNSWLECANYVNGGWFDGIYDLINAEKYIFFTSIAFLFIYKVTSLLKHKVRNNEI
jgi:hypothetical protein